MNAPIPMKHDTPENERIAAQGTILRTQVGSGVHGIAIAGQDDRDEMGVCIEPPEYVVGLRRFEQYEYRTQPMHVRSGHGDLDLVIYGLRKWARLALAGNPTVLLLLFTPTKDIVHVTDAGRELRENAAMFLSRAAAPKFIGYLRSQRDRLLGLKAQRTNRPELVEKYGWDCYLDDTEFLTHSGWLRYDEIADGESLATINQATGAVEFQIPTERVAKPYSGPINLFRHRYTSCAVTPNHRMWTSPVNRGSCGRIGNVYRPEVANWSFRRADELRGHHHVRVVGTPREDEYPVSDAMLSLVGAFVSEGSVAKRLSDGSASVLSFTQKVGNRLESVMATVDQEHPIRTFTYTRKDEWRPSPIECHTYTLANRRVSAQLDRECGRGSRNKHLPGWVFDLSARQAEVLLAALMAGDGTLCRGGWQVYYTISPRLAGDVQALAIIAGRRSNAWGPYDKGMYQVMVQDPGREFETISIRCNHKVEIVKDARIVCFTVPNETLVTRRNGRVAMHGNTKFGSHMVRLGIQGVELLETGQITLPIPEPWLTYLRDMRQGKYTRDEALATAQEFEHRIGELATTSHLPERPDHALVDQWLIRTYQQHWESTR